ncbi:MAG: cell division protein SepF [Clostridia bacterium]|nr:cell division protein SepF [Clostridia bacterium]
MKDLMNKMLNFIGVPSDEDEEEEKEFVMRSPQPRHLDRTKSNVSVISDTKRGKVVDIHTTTQFKVVVLNARKFEDVMDIADHLKAKQPVVINMEDLDQALARRMIDFLSGVVYSADGGIQKISKDIMLVTPYTVEIMGDFQDELRSKGLFPWED